MLIPSIDLAGGKAVQLTQGRQKVLERDDPLGLAADFSRYGEIALIDLDAAMGEGDNGSLVREICRTAECRVGGGIRSIDKARRLVEHGAAKVIVGTRAFREDGVDQEFLSELALAIGRERVVIALDNVRGKIVVDGWRRDLGLGVPAVIEAAEAFASEFLFTRVEREGLMGGTDLDAVRELVPAARIPVTRPAASPRPPRSASFPRSAPPFSSGWPYTRVPSPPGPPSPRPWIGKRPAASSRRSFRTTRPRSSWSPGAAGNPWTARSRRAARGIFRDAGSGSG